MFYVQSLSHFGSCILQHFNYTLIYTSVFQPFIAGKQCFRDNRLQHSTFQLHMMSYSKLWIPYIYEQNCVYIYLEACILDVYYEIESNS